MTTLKVTSIDQLNPDLVAQTHAELAQLLQEKYPEIELTRGAVHDLLTYFGGVFGAWDQTELRRYLDARSLKAIEADPVLADPELADHVFSMYRVDRKTGDYAVGEVVVVVLANLPVVIPAGFTLAATGVTFRAQTAFTGIPANIPRSSDTDRVLNPLGDGTYAFTITVICETEGPTGNIPRNTKLSPTAPPPNFVTAYAANDFTGGVLTESNAAILQRLQEGVAAKTLSGSVNIRALIREQELFQHTLAYSVLGFGNVEMTRDQHTIFPGSFGGRIDIYARTRELPTTISLEKTATLMELTATGSVWQFSLGRDDMPGFYEVVQVRRPADPADVAGFAITMDRRAMDLSPGLTLTPDIVLVEEGVYSRHQTAVIRFLDTATPRAGLTIGDKASYLVGVQGMPLIADLQDFLAGSLTRYKGGDILVRAAIPCRLTVNFDIRSARGVAAPDLTAIQQALATLVNNLGFDGQLHASQISDAVHGFLADRQALGPIDMQGYIRRPSGEPHVIRSTTVLSIPNDPGNYVTGLTTAFILNPANVGIRVVTEGFTEDT